MLRCENILITAYPKGRFGLPASLLDPSALEQHAESTSKAAKCALAGDFLSSNQFLKKISNGDEGLALHQAISEAEPLTACLRLKSADNRESWKKIENIAWESAWRQSAPLVELGYNIIRVLNPTAPPETIKLGERNLRMLVIAAHPKGAGIDRLDADEAVKEIKAAWVDCASAPEIHQISGKDTQGQLERLLNRDTDWDFVHVIAHGRRKDADDEPHGFCLENDKGDPKWVGGEIFAGLIARVKAPRLVTLHVCQSSPMAIDIGFAKPGTWVVATLHKMRDESLRGFFGKFYSQLFVPPAVDSYVQSAFGDVVRKLISAHDAEWFLPLLYGPGSAENSTECNPFFNCAAERDFREILELVHAGKFHEAHERAGVLMGQPGIPVVARRAARCRENIGTLIDFSGHINELASDIKTEADAPNRRWDRFYDHWRERNFFGHRVAGPIALDDSSSMVWDPALRAMKDKLDETRQLVVDGLAKLAEFQRGVLAALIEGCRKLVCAAKSPGEQALLLRTLEVFATELVQYLKSAAEESRGASADSILAISERVFGFRSLLRDEAGDLLDSGIGQGVELRGKLDRCVAECSMGIVEGLKSEISTGTPAASPELPQVIKTLEKLSKIERALDEPRLRNFLQENDLQSLRDLLAKSCEACRRGLEQCRPRETFPAELLRPGRRMELCRALLGDSPLQPVQLAPIPAGSASKLLEMARTFETENLGRGATFDPQSIGTGRLSVLANEGAPFSLVAELRMPLNPYQCLAPFGASADSSAQQLHDEVVFKAGEASDPTLRPLLLQATSELTDARRRLCVDARLLPCQNPAECTARFVRLAESIFSGRAVPSDLGAGMHPLDRAALLTVAGNIEQGLRAALDAARGWLNNFDAHRAAFLLSVHQAALSRTDPALFAEAARRAMVHLGVLAGDSQSFREWLGRRYAVYRLPLPSEIEPVAEMVIADLTSLLAAELDAMERNSPTQRLGRDLHKELRAEIEGAKLAVKSPLLQNKPMGYLAALSDGQLMAFAAHMKGAFRTLCRMSDDTYLQFVTTTNMSVEVFHQMVFLFSDLRTAWVGQDADSLAILEPLLPDPADLEALDEAPPEVIDQLETSESARRFPFHQALGAEDGAPVLAAHAALLAAGIRLALAREELRKLQPSRPRVVTELDALRKLEQYIKRLGYPLAGRTTGADEGIPGLCLAWAASTFEKLNADDSDQVQQHRQSWESACTLLELLINRYSLSGESVKLARSSMHLNCGVFIANRFVDGPAALHHVRLAYKADPTVSRTVINYVRASRMAYGQSGNLSSPEAKALLIEGIGVAKRHLELNPDEAELRQDTKELEAMLDDSSVSGATQISSPVQLK